MGKPKLHGRDHRPGGADPIDDRSIRYNFLNDGEWLHVVTEGTPPFGIDYGMTFRDESGSGLELYSTSRMHILATTTVELFTGTAFNVHSNGDILLDADDDITITADGEFTFTAAGGGLTTITSNGLFSVGSVNDQAVFSASDRITIASANEETWVLLPTSVGTPSDYSFAVGITDGIGGIIPYFRVDNDGTVHTASAVVVDL